MKPFKGLEAVSLELRQNMTAPDTALANRAAASGPCVVQRLDELFRSLIQAPAPLNMANGVWENP